jgi:hypothetical protein
MIALKTKICTTIMYCIFCMILSTLTYTTLIYTYMIALKYICDCHFSVYQASPVLYRRI